MPLDINKGGTGETTIPGVRKRLGLGDIALLDEIDLTTDVTGVLPIANGGTDADNAIDARDNLGLEIGVDIQAYDADLEDIANLTPADGNFIVGNGSEWTTESGSTARTSLGAQTQDAGLDALAAFNTNGIIVQTANNTFAGRTLTGTTNRVTVTNGSGVSGDPVVDISSSYIGQSSINTVGTITTGVWNGTDVAIADGGTGSSTAIGALVNLGLPVGIILPYGGSTAPSGWLFCYGQDISRTTYASLFSIFSTTYGSGDGSTTFNLPDLRGRVVGSKDNMGGTSANRLTNQSGGLDGDVLGATGGSETHTLSTAQMPTHNHGVNDPGHFHRSVRTLDGTPLSSGGTFYDIMAEGGALDSTVVTSSVTTGVSIQNAGSGNAHNNVQPTIILNQIVFTGV